MRARDHALSVRVLPEPLYVQPSRGRVRLLHDLWVENAGEAEWLLTGLEVTALDGRGVAVGRRALDENGLQPSVATLPARRVPPGGAITVFNPFPDWPEELELAELRCRLFFLGEGDEGGEAVAEAVVRPRRFEQSASLALPLDGRVLVDDGHDHYAHHRRVPLSEPVLRERLGLVRNPMRYAWDFVLVDERGEARPGAAGVEGYFRFEPPRTRNEDYLVFDRPVLAPASGTVVSVRGDLRDNESWRPGLGLEELAADLSLLLGNAVVLDHGGGEHGVLAHLREGSVGPAPGDRVQAGEEVGRVGNSGDSYYPHLHFHVMTGPDLREAEGLPVCFSGFHALLGPRWSEPVHGAPETGEIVSRRRLGA
jgi:hypothetical protein